MHERKQLGWREWLSLPELAIPAIKAKVDTGARTSALHVADLTTYSEKHHRKVKFTLHPLQKRTDIELDCIADVLDERLVRDSGGHTERRVVIYTTARLGNMEWPIEITLTNREDMMFRMLLGRTALNGRFIVDPQLSYQVGKRPRGIYLNEAKKL